MNKKTAIYIGGGVILLAVGFFVFKKLKGRKYNMPKPQTGQGQTSSTSSSTSTSTSTYNPKADAEALRDSMKGFGTDEEMFFRTAQSLTPAQRQQVLDYYNTNIGDLRDWIIGDFSGQEKQDALQLFNL